MHDLYFASLVDNAEELTEEWTLCSGYENPPSTSLHYECRQAREAFRDMKNKLDHILYGQCYYVDLKGYERKRWELEFNRLYENYLDKMEDWIGDRANIKRQVEPGLHLRLPEFDYKKIIIGMFVASGITILLHTTFSPNEQINLNSQTELFNK